MIDSMMISLQGILLSNPFLAPLVALLGGIIASFSPCTLSMIPLIIGFVTGMEKNNKNRAFKISLMFVLGSSIVFTALGLLAGVLGNMLSFSSGIWYMFLGMILLIMALEFMEIIHVVPQSGLLNKNKKQGYTGAFIAGSLSALFASPCSTPVLIVILGIASLHNSILYGAILLLLYSIGYGLIIIGVGTSAGGIQKVLRNPKYHKSNNIIRYVFGVLMIALALYMYYLGF